MATVVLADFQLQYFGTQFRDIVRGNFNDNEIYGAAGDDFLYGEGGNDYLFGNEGNDRLYGGDGDDFLFDVDGNNILDGGAGNDIFKIAHFTTGTTNVMDGGSGRDRVSYTLNSYAGQPMLIVDLATGKGGGSALGDTYVSIEDIEGGTGVDKLLGNDVGNFFYASEGLDFIDGRSGNDGFVASEDGVAGSLKIGLASSLMTADIKNIFSSIFKQGIAATDMVATWKVWHDADTDGIVDADEVSTEWSLLRSVEIYEGTDGKDTITGGAANEVISGGTGGSDSLNGGAGFDYVSYASATEGVKIALLKTATDDITTDKDTLVNFEGIIGSDYGDELQGNSLANTIFGGLGVDFLDGYSGNDILDGEEDDDILEGGAGNDILIGGEGADILSGGAGTDTVSYRDATGGVKVNLLSGKGTSNEFGTIEVSHAEGDIYVSIEQVVGSQYDDDIRGNNGANRLEGRDGEDWIDGCDGNDVIFGDTDPNSLVPAGTGTLKPSHDVDDDCGCGDDDDLPTSPKSYSDTLIGGCGDDILYGQLGIDTLIGGEGNDTLDGGESIDLLFAGDGNDILRGGPGFDFLVGGNGNDTADYSTSKEAVTANLGAFWLNSGGDASGGVLTELVEILIGGTPVEDFTSSALFSSFAAMIDEQLGLRIPDITLGIENLTGSAYNDNLTGNAGANVLDGGKGKDRLAGGLGNDTYIFDGTDTIVENAGQGTDTVRSSVSYTLAANLENLTLLGTAALNGTGNSAANVITGNAAANTLDGGTGADRLIGGAGNDTYVTDGGDTIVEAANQGTDTVRSSATHTLSANVENLVLTGTAAINGTGNTLANALTGNSGANVLAGGLGNDRLTGGGGHDSFLFNTALNASTNRDTIVDFSNSSSNNDRFQLDDAIFTKLGKTGAMNSSFFKLSSQTQDADDYIIYNKTTGDLFYDADGKGAGVGIRFATLSNAAQLTAADFFVV